MDSWIRCRVHLYAFFFLRCFNILCYASGFYMLVFVVRCLCCARVRARVCVIHWHCSAQLSMFNMEKRYRNKIIIIIINSLRLSHRSRISTMTHDFLTVRCFARISLAVSVTAALKVSVNMSKSMSLSSMERAANFPPIIAWKTSATCGSFSLSTSNLILACPCFLVLFKCSLKVIITSSWSLPMLAPGKLLVLAMFTVELNRFLTMM